MDAFKKKAIALSALPLALLFVAAFQSSDSVPGQLKAILSEISSLKSEISGLEAQVASLANKGPRKFYLTRTGHNGAQALTACAAGYHMASLWEILDPSNLRYDTALGFNREDSGFGPPAGIISWIRTGVSSSASPPPGIANCNAWTSASGTDFGTRATLSTSWNLPARVADPWLSEATTCNAILSVWCVQD